MRPARAFQLKGTLTVNSAQLNNGTGEALGNTYAVTSTNQQRVITVNNGATLSWTVNNAFGNGYTGGTVAAANLVPSTLAPGGTAALPLIVLNGSTMSATRYNLIGNVVMNNGSTLTQSASDSGSFFGYQFRDSITVQSVPGNSGIPNAPSMITANSATEPNHLFSNTTFTVSDVTGSPDPDLIVSAGLTNPSGDYSGISATGAS